MSASQHSPTVALCRLYKCTSKTGSTYFRGRMGPARVVLLKDREISDDGSEIWNLLVQEAPPKGEAGDSRSEARAEPKPQAKAKPASGGGSSFDDDIPFLRG